MFPGTSNRPPFWKGMNPSLVTTMPSNNALRDQQISAALKAGCTQADAERIADLACARAGRVSAARASEEKGYPHPGNTIDLPNGGGQIILQYGHPDEVGRNGCFMHDVLEGIIANLKVFQQDGHPLSCSETGATILHLEAARESILARRRDRQARGTFQTDKP